MALIVDPDDLNQGVEITITPGTLTIELSVAGNLSNDGVTGQALYSFLKEEWKNDATLIPFEFPMESLTPEQFEFRKGWKPADDTTRNLLRSCGWRELSAADAILREYVGIVSLGNIDGSDTAYYAFDSDTATTDFDFPGVINQGIQSFGDISNGNFDKRNEELTLYIRTQGKLYGLSTTTAIGVSALSYIAYRFPLAEAADLKVTTSDNDIDTLAPYTGMSIEYVANQQNIDGQGNAPFSVIVDGNGGTAEEIYEFVQRQLRDTGTIDVDSNQVGVLANSLMNFVGDTLITTTGVFIQGFDASDTNRITFTDDNDVARTYPFVAAGTINFNTNLVNDPSAIYRMFFSSGFGTAGAILVEDTSNASIAGNVGGNASISFDFDYDGNNQGGRTPGTDAAITLVAIGEDTAQYVLATGTITRAVGQNFGLVAPLERNYNNP